MEQLQTLWTVIADAKITTLERDRGNLSLLKMYDTLILRVHHVSDTFPQRLGKVFQMNKKKGALNAKRRVHSRLWSSCCNT